MYLLVEAFRCLNFRKLTEAMPESQFEELFISYRHVYNQHIIFFLFLHTCPQNSGLVQYRTLEIIIFTHAYQIPFSRIFQRHQRKIRILIHNFISGTLVTVFATILNLFIASNLGELCYFCFFNIWYVAIKSFEWLYNNHLIYELRGRTAF